MEIETQSSGNFEVSLCTICILKGIKAKERSNGFERFFEGLERILIYLWTLVGFQVKTVKILARCRGRANPWMFWCYLSLGSFWKMAFYLCIMLPCGSRPQIRLHVNIIEIMGRRRGRLNPSLSAWCWVSLDLTYFQNLRSCMLVIFSYSLKPQIFTVATCFWYCIWDGSYSFQHANRFRHVWP